jgi:hypothetical protein
LKQETLVQMLQASLRRALRQSDASPDELRSPPRVQRAEEPPER